MYKLDRARNDIRAFQRIKNYGTFNNSTENKKANISNFFEPFDEFAKELETLSFVSKHPISKKDETEVSKEFKIKSKVRQEISRNCDMLTKEEYMIIRCNQHSLIKFFDISVHYIQTHPDSASIQLTMKKVLNFESIDSDHYMPRYLERKQNDFESLKKIINKVFKPQFSLNREKDIEIVYKLKQFSKILRNL